MRRILKEIPAFNGEKIVLLDWSGEAPQFCNLLKVDAAGRTVWTAQPHHPLEGIWTEAEFKDGILRAYNFAGYSDVLDYETGKIRERTFVK